MIILIDPGHGGHDPGAVGPKGLKEKDIVLAISLLLAKMLNNFDVGVRLTRENDRAVELQSRPALANSLGARLLLSIHCNSFTNPTARGVEIWHSFNGDYGNKFHSEAKKIATTLQEELVKGTGLWDRGIKTRLVEDKSSPLFGLDYYAVIRKANCPSLVLELGFINNPAEEALLGNPTFQEKAARSIMEGVVKALGIPEKEVGQPSQDYPMLKGTTIHFEGIELKGFILDGRSYVEVRKLAEAMGAEVHWDPIKNRVEIKR